MAKILVGGIHQETNTYSPLRETYASFNKYRGMALLEHLHTSPAKLIQEAGHIVVPAIYASIIPSGMITANEFELFIEDFLSYCTDDIDGIWLSLHGAMTVTDIGSAEADLVTQLRARYGNNIPIFGSFDFHGNMSLDLVSQINYITAYHTAPHVDIYETGCRAVRALIQCLEQNILPHTKYVPIPMVMPGELVITSDWPTNYIQRKLRALESETGVMALSLFCGFAWSDCPRNRMAITVSDTWMSSFTLERILAVAAEIWTLRNNFGYGKSIVKAPEAAVMMSAQLDTKKIIISDTGDNVTAGCAGDNALLAGLMIKKKLENALVAGIADKPAVKYCFSHNIGAEVAFNLGGTIDPKNSKRISVRGHLLQKNTFSAEELPLPLHVAVVRVGGVDLLICDQRYSVISRKHINDTGVYYDDYRIIAVKLGYLFPDFAEQNPHSILALTPGNAYQNTGEILYTNGPQRYFPRDDFIYMPEFDLPN